ncbi:MAG: glycerol kinase, partial [Treponema sp.]|nr:glycerol kinase [Treponema sp.]
QACIAPGESKTTYGTGCFMLMHTGEKAVLSKNNLLTTIALGYKGKITYALEGSVFMGGAIIKWLRDELGLISSAPECDVLAELVPDSAGLVLVPAFTGLGTPYWDMYARGLLIGLTRGVNKAHICRAALEAIAFQVKDIIHCMEEDASSVLSCMKVDGGASVSEILMQFQADMLDTKVLRPKNTETTALGAAYLAGLAVGFWQDEEELFSTWQKDKSFEPKMQREKREELYARWKKAVERSRSWLDV